MAFGVALAVPCGIVTGTAIGSSLKIRATASVPGNFDVYLPRGEWEVYELTGTISGTSVGPFSYTKQTEGPVTFDATDIRVTGPDGRSISIRDRLSPNSFETYQSGSKVYLGIASFDLTASAQYRIGVAARQSGQVIVARPPFAGFGSVVGWIIGAVAGVVAFSVGIILLILDLDRRRRAKFRTPAASVGPVSSLHPTPHPARPQWPTAQRSEPTEAGMPDGAVPPGWHPDPSGRSHLRYWDGVTWTEHVSTGGTLAIDPL